MEMEKNYMTYLILNYNLKKAVLQIVKRLFHLS